jgi:hypothetical protein
MMALGLVAWAALDTWCRAGRNIFDIHPTSPSQTQRTNGMVHFGSNVVVTSGQVSHLMMKFEISFYAQRCCKKDNVANFDTFFVHAFEIMRHHLKSFVQKPFVFRFLCTSEDIPKKRNLDKNSLPE